MVGGADVLSVNPAFWEKAYSDNFAPLCSRARRQLTNGDPAEAEDAVSEAFMRAMRYAHNPETIQNPLSYLWTVVKRVWAAQNAHSSRTKTDSLDALDTETLESLSSIQVEPEVQAILEREALRDELRLKLGPLTLEEQSLLNLYLEDYSWTEIASMLGEDEKLTRFRWYKFIARQRYRLAKGKAKTQASGCA